MSRPLDGVRVVDLGQIIAGPAATQALADLGADVIKVEPPGGESSRGIGSYGTGILGAYTRGKRAVALDLKHERGLAAAHRLVDSADVVVANLRPGALEEFGLGAGQLRRARPELVHGTLSGFGSAGPGRTRPGVDIAAQAESGMMSVTGDADGVPQRVGFPVVDAMAAQVLAQALLAAYVRRLRTGEGDTVEVSLLEVAVHMQAVNWVEWFETGVEPVRRGNGQPTIAPAADVVATSDGAIVLSAYVGAHFARLCRAIGAPGLADDPRFATNADRVRNRAELLREIGAAFAGTTTDEAMALLTGNRIVAGRVRAYRDVPDAPELRDSGVFTTVTDRAGTPHRTIGAPWRMGSVPDAPGSWIPQVGEHTAEVLRELGHSDAEIDALAGCGAVVVADPARPAGSAPQ